MNKIRTFLCLLILLPFSLFAAERLEWSDDENVFEYKVEVKNKTTGEVKSYTTQDNFIDINEQSGDYEFRVKPVDVLGREGNASAWQGFKISKALTPVLTTMPPAAWKLPETSGELATIPLSIQNVSPRTKVQLVNQETNQVVEGQLVLKVVGGIASASGIKVPQLASGEWKIKVTDPSGRSAESGVIKIESQKEERLKKEALAKAETEKAAVEKAALAAAGGTAAGAGGLAAAEAGLAAGEGELASAGVSAGSEGGTSALAEESSVITDNTEKVFASNAQKLRIEKQIAKRVRGYQKKIH